MNKKNSEFFCTQCSYKPPKWLGCCPQCNEWNSIETRIQKKQISFQSTAKDLIPLSAIPLNEHNRIKSDISEWDSVLGGGIVPGAFISLTGDPGIGKSSLLLRIADKIAQNHTVIYCSTEESLPQIKQRAQRIKIIDSPNLLFCDTTDLESILAIATHHQPQLLIIDSIQNCIASDITHTHGSAGQIRTTAFALMRLSKEHIISIIATGHITKEGIMAGPKMLEHMVDAVFYLQGDDRSHTRMLRATKNRFGTVHEIGFFEMNETGMAEVPNINKYLLDNASHAPGALLISTLEGTRSILVEMQALVTKAHYGTPQRVITGIDHKQVILIIAILEKYLHIPFNSQDIFFKVGGGFRIKDSAADLGIALALLSSFYQHALPKRSAALGELSLTGEIKPVKQFSIHLKEAEKLHINTFLISKKQQTQETTILSAFSHVYELLTLFEHTKNNT